MFARSALSPITYILNFLKQATEKVASNGAVAEVKTASADCNAKSFETAISDKLDYIVQAVDDFKLITNVQEENKKLKESLEALSNKHNTLINVASDLNTRIKNLETSAKVC
jgi:tRNA A37 threonylcarbamoyladenosine dehydratase